MTEIKIPKTIYLKDYEKEDIREIAELKNKKRIAEGKKPMPISTHIHDIIKIGIKHELERNR